jgi:hypothetical protein
MSAGSFRDCSQWEEEKKPPPPKSIRKEEFFPFSHREFLDLSVERIVILHDRCTERRSFARLNVLRQFDDRDYERGLFLRC